MRLVFIGSGDIGLPSLEALLSASGHQVVAVVTQPDRPVGRSQQVTFSQIKQTALAAGVPVLQPEKIRDAVDDLRALQADLFIVIAYGQILSRAVLDAPRLGCLNVHASLLPRHRGASPIQAAIREGDTETGVTIMWMDEGLDTGDVLLMESTPIHYDETGGVLHDRLAAMAPPALLRALQMIAAGNAPRMPQDNTRATITRKLGREHGRIEWNTEAARIERLVRAYHPWPGTYCLLQSADEKLLHLKIWQATVVEHAEACPVGGTILAADERLLVSCGKGVLELTEVQLEGRKRMSARDFLRGHPLRAGDVLQ